MTQSKDREIFISVRDITQQFGEQKVLRGVSFDVYRGELLAVIGASGAGKSVILKHLAGLIDPLSGEIYVDGHKISNVSEEARAPLRSKIGFMFQGGALFDSMTVAQNVAFPLVERRMKDPDIDRRVNAALESVYLDGHGDKMPSELSGGMIKRVAVARAIVVEPECLFYDEPTAGLDPIVTDGISYLIREFNVDHQKTTVIVSHDMGSVMKIADRIIYLREGEIYWQGTPEELRASRDPVCYQFIEGLSGEDWSRFSPQSSQKKGANESSSLKSSPPSSEGIS